MSKQFSILATDTDLRALETLLSQSGDVKLFSRDVTEDGQLQLLSELAIPVSKAGSVPLFCYLGPADGHPKIVVKRRSAVKTTVEVQPSELIEFMRPFYDGISMRDGRLYYENRYFEAGNLIAKNPNFCHWADRVMARVKRALVRNKALDAYVGADAMQAIESGKIAIKSSITPETAITFVSEGKSKSLN